MFSSIDHHPDPHAHGLTNLRDSLLLTAGLNTLDVGIEIWDEQDRLVFRNKKLRRMLGALHTPNDLDQSFEAILRNKLRSHLIKSAIGREDEWLAHRLAKRGSLKQPHLLGLDGDRWVNVYENRTPFGYLVVLNVDVTDLIRQGRALQASNMQLAIDSTTDALTGLANRRHFDRLLAIEWQRCARAGQPLSLLMMDIDHFKKFNDHYGHPAGDECLRRVATVLSQSVRRAGEVVARYGGEEFVLLLPGADEDYARDIARQCLAGLHHQAMPHAASPTLPIVSLSIGVACAVPKASDNASALVNAADAAMYRAKTTGRAHHEVAARADWDMDYDTPRTRPAPLE